MIISRRRGCLSEFGFGYGAIFGLTFPTKAAHNFTLQTVI